MSYPHQLSHRSRALPHINSIMNSLKPCPNHIHGCKRVFGTFEDFLQHQQTCKPPAGQATRVDSFTLDLPSQAFLPLGLNTQLPSSESDDSDSSSTVFTPGTSRAPSPATQIPVQRSSQVTNRVTKRTTRRASSPLSGGADRKVKKTEKEKMNRSNQAAVLSRIEDLLAYYVGWERQEQSGGNGNAAGLQTNKINLLKGQEAILSYLMHQAFERAILENNVGKFQAEIQQVANDALEEGYKPHSGTFLYSEGETCTHANTKSKQCVTHGTGDWRECRKEKSRGTFLKNVATWCQQQSVTFPQSLLPMGGRAISTARSWFACGRSRQA